MAGKKGAVKAAKLVASKYSPVLNKCLSPLALRFLSEYRKDFDVDRALKVVEVPDVERDGFLSEPKLVKHMGKVEEWAQHGASWNKEAAIARHRELQDELLQQVKEGNYKAANAAANMSKIEIDAHGLTRKEDSGKGIVVNINMDLGGGKVAEVTGKVIEGELVDE